MNRQTKWITACVCLIAIVWMISGCGGPKELDDEEKIRLYYEAGIGYIHQGEPEKALDSFQRAYNVNNGYPQVLQGMGLAYHQMGVPESALNWFKKTETITPDDPQLLNNIASVYLVLKQFDQAISYATRALEDESYRTPTAAYFNRGLARKNTGDLDGAVDDFTTAMRFDPMYSAARLELAWICLEQGNIDRAIKLASSVIKLNKNEAEAYLLRGEAYWERGYVTKAENDFTIVTRMENANSNIQQKAHNWLDKIQ